jgi:hypothetical protein
VPGFSNLLGWRRNSEWPRGPGRRKVRRKATLVPPGLTRPELALVAGSVLFHYRRVEEDDLPPQLRPVIAALMWRAARLVVMSERGAGTATRHDLDRCGDAVYRHLGMLGFWAADLDYGTEIDNAIDRQLQDFFSGPQLPLSLLVERLAPGLGPGSRAEVAAALEELIRDLAEQFGMTHPVNLRS